MTREWVNGIPAPKPANFDELAATWDNPQAFAIERARYYAQLREEGLVDAGRDWTETER